MENIAKAQQYLKEFKGSSYIFGNNCIDRLPELCQDYGNRVSVILSGPRAGVGKPYTTVLLLDALEGAGYILAGEHYSWCLAQRTQGGCVYDKRYD
jgi:hypothetical protein